MEISLRAQSMPESPIRKLAKHAVQSVRQRVQNLREIKDIGDIDAFRQQLEQTMKETI